MLLHCNWIRIPYNIHHNTFWRYKKTDYRLGKLLHRSSGANDLHCQMTDLACSDRQEFQFQYLCLGAYRYFDPRLLLCERFLKPIDASERVSAALGVSVFFATWCMIIYNICVIYINIYMIALCVTGQPNYPNNKVHGANMGLIWGQQDPGGPHVGPMNLAICVFFSFVFVFSLRYCINSKKWCIYYFPKK